MGCVEGSSMAGSFVNAAGMAKHHALLSGFSGKAVFDKLANFANLLVCDVLKEDAHAGFTKFAAVGLCMIDDFTIIIERFYIRQVKADFNLLSYRKRLLGAYE